MRLKEVLKIIRSSFSKFGEDKPIEQASTLAFFTILGIPPILIIIISILGLIIGEQSATQEVYAQIKAIIGQEGTKLIRDIVKNYQNTERSTIGTIIGIIIFIIAASTLFVTIQKSLNTIWSVKPKPKSNLLKVLIDRSLSFGVIISLGFILLISLLIDAGVAILGNYLSDIIPWLSEALLYAADVVISITMATIVFMILFKVLPDVKIKWKVTWVGALVTAILFTIGKFLIGYGLGNSDVGSMYGAAGSVVIVLLWVFYSSIILFFGAEITQQYAEQIDREIKPKDHAVLLETHEVEKEGGKATKKAEKERN